MFAASRHLARSRTFLDIAAMQLRGTEQDWFWGLDIGGTKIGLCIGHGDGRVERRSQFTTDHGVDGKATLQRAAAELVALARGLPAPLALGAACPGPITRDGRFLDPPNMPRWHQLDAAATLRACVGVPVTTMNDANAGVLAEWLWGDARGADTAVFCTMSTGMGAGLIVGGALHQGRHGFAAEIGHLRLSADGPIGFGKRGSVEGFLSGPGILQVAEQEARIALQVGEPSELLRSHTLRSDLTTEDVCRLALQGDTAARRATDRCADKLGELCAILVDVLEPDVIVLGTIARAYPELFLPRAQAVLQREALAHSLHDLRLVASQMQERGDKQALAAARYGGP